LNNLIIVVCTLFLFISCGLAQIKAGGPEKTNVPAQVKTEFNPVLDSAKFAVFIKEQQVDDSAADLLRSFYKSRRYQYAWFKEDGIAEPTRSIRALHKITSTTLEIRHLCLMHCTTRLI
jgi:hypothetical protein